MKEKSKQLVLTAILIMVFSFQLYAQNNRGKAIYTIGEIKKMCRIPIDSSKLNKTSMAQNVIPVTSKKGLLKTESIPNWRSMMGEVEYQNNDPCPNDCWAHVATGVVEGQLNISLGYNSSINLNESELGCYNLDWPSIALNYIKNHYCPVIS